LCTTFFWLLRSFFGREPAGGISADANAALYFFALIFNHYLSRQPPSPGLR
jgi:hypothetical protein